METLSHGQQDPGITPRRESEIRHQERQLCAAELLMLADAQEGSWAWLLRQSAGKIARREVA